MTGQRVSGAAFVHDQRAAAAEVAARRWRERVAVRHRRWSASRRAPAAAALVERLIGELAAGEVAMCEHVASSSYLGVVRLFPSGGLRCDLCSIAWVATRSAWACDQCGREVAALGPLGGLPMVFELAGVLLQAQLCASCWRGDRV